MAIKFPSWEVTRVTSAHSLSAITNYMILSNARGFVKCVSSHSSRAEETQICVNRRMKAKAGRKKSELVSDGLTAAVISPPWSHPPGPKKTLVLGPSF